MLHQFELKIQEEEKSRATVEKYLRNLRRFVNSAAGRTVDKSLILEYKAELGRSYAPSSANGMIAALNAFLKAAGWMDCCVKQFRIQRRTFCSESRELRKEEYLALVRTAERRNPRLALLLQTICTTGIRVSEVACITVESVHRGEAEVRCKGKTRRIFLVSALQKKLMRYIRERGIRSGPVFVTRSGRPMNRSNIWTEMKHLCKEAGVSPNKVFPHNLRHLFARTFYGMEKDIVKLADILGHSSINTTRIYIISTGAEHRRKMENMRLIL